MVKIWTSGDLNKLIRAARYQGKQAQCCIMQNLEVYGKERSKINNMLKLISENREHIKLVGFHLEFPNVLKWDEAFRGYIHKQINIMKKYAEEHDIDFSHIFVRNCMTP